MKLKVHELARYMALGLLLASCTSVKTVKLQSQPGKAPDIRVLLDSGKKILKVVSTGGCRVITPGGIVLLKSSRGGVLNAFSRSSELAIRLMPEGKVASGSNVMQIIPKGKSELKFKGVSYAGVLRIICDSRGELALVNVLPLEEYLEGVLPHEMGARRPDEFAAFEAQAVAARTYALSRILARSAQMFDVYAGVQDQVYGGRKGKNRLASAAIKKNRGMALEYNGSLAWAYYCASCGGHTSNIELMWPEREPARYLSGILDRGAHSDRSFCSGGRYFRWRYSYTGRELGEILRDTLPRVLGARNREIGYLLDIRITERTRSGRVRCLEVVTTTRTFRVTGDRIRWVLPADHKKGKILPSTMFNLNKIKKGGRIVFLSITGGGNGHGVGMCQNGALEMARKGYTFRMILSHYYPGCKVAKRY